jgi:hypothetical protein
VLRPCWRTGKRAERRTCVRCGCAAQGSFALNSPRLWPAAVRPSAAAFLRDNPLVTAR